MSTALDIDRLPDELDTFQVAELTGLSPNHIRVATFYGYFPEPCLRGRGGSPRRRNRWRKSDVVAWLHRKALRAESLRRPPNRMPQEMSA